VGDTVRSAAPFGDADGAAEAETDADAEADAEAVAVLLGETVALVVSSASGACTTLVTTTPMYRAAASVATAPEIARIFPRRPVESTNTLLSSDSVDVVDA